MRHRFHSIGVNARRELVLLSRRGTMWPLSFNAARDQYSLTYDSQADAFGCSLVKFESEEYWANTPHADLRVARWPDGSRAAIDPRGLLHLQSSDRRVPACTLALSDRATTAGWTADGRWWGWSYFIGDNPATPVSVIMDDVIHPFVERLG
jgi:hypothetical protein